LNKNKRLILLPKVVSIRKADYRGIGLGLSISLNHHRDHCPAMRTITWYRLHFLWSNCY